MKTTGGWLNRIGDIIFGEWVREYYFRAKSAVHRFDSRLGKAWHPIADSATARAAAFLVAVASLIVLLQTGLSIQAENAERIIQREIQADERLSRNEDREARAWSTLLRRATGNTGKGAAINTLLERGVNLRDVNVSCAAAGGKASNEWNGDYERSGCSVSVVLTNINFNLALAEGDSVNLNLPVDKQVKVDDLPDAERWRQEVPRLKGLNLSGTTIEDLRATNLRMEINAAQTAIIRSDLEGSMFAGPIRGALFIESNLRRTEWIRPEVEFHIRRSDLSEAEFSLAGLEGEVAMILKYSYAFLDRPVRCNGPVELCVANVFEKLTYCGTRQQANAIRKRKGLSKMPTSAQINAVLVGNTPSLDSGCPETIDGIEAFAFSYDAAHQWNLVDFTLGWTGKE